METMSFMIPHGSESGQMLRVDRMGDSFNGVYGNLILKINLIFKQFIECFD